MDFMSDLAAIRRDLAETAASTDAPAVIVIGGVRHTCEPGEPTDTLAGEFEGEDTEHTASVIVFADEFATRPQEGTLATWAGRTWRITGVTDAVDGLEYTLTLSGVRK